MRKERGFINPFSQMQLIGMAIVIAVASASAFWGGYELRDLYAKRDQLKLEQEKQKIEEANKLTIQKKEDEYYQLSQSLEETLKKINQKAKVITKVVEKEIEKPIYRECVLPPSGVQLINNTATELNSSRHSEGSTKPPR
jgi:hypothetical protein